MSTQYQHNINTTSIIDYRWNSVDIFLLMFFYDLLTFFNGPDHSFDFWVCTISRVFIWSHSYSNIYALGFKNTGNNNRWSFLIFWSWEPNIIKEVIGWVVRELEMSSGLGRLDVKWAGSGGLYWGPTQPRPMSEASWTGPGFFLVC